MRASIEPSARIAKNESNSTVRPGLSRSVVAIASGSAICSGVTASASAFSARSSVSSLVDRTDAMRSPSSRSFSSSTRSRSECIAVSASWVLASAASTAVTTVIATILNFSVLNQRDKGKERPGKVIRPFHAGGGRSAHGRQLCPKRLRRMPRAGRRRSLDQRRVDTPSLRIS
jgi:hypothetical protein